MSAQPANFNGASLLVVGGAGFVGSNLVKQLLTHDIKRLAIVDNLLSSDMVNVPDDKRVVMIPRSITDDGVLQALPERSRLRLAPRLLPRQPVVHRRSADGP